MALDPNPKGKSKGELVILLRKWVQRCYRSEATDNNKHIKKLKKEWAKLEGKYNILLKEASDELTSYAKFTKDLQSEILRLKGE